ncbi:MAG: hypothetical protein DRH56_08195 [Deltaproteobacteria bacterium]|nr:MAG: hypothetical protein DRH56_08195 [Deltaproteobacteria bacterium]
MFTVATREGVRDLQASVQVIGTDILVAIRGGTRPHIGAVAVAQPRPSLRDPGKTSATASVFCFPGHKEDELVKAAAEAMAAALNARVVVTAGVHWDDLDDADIRTIIRNTRVLGDLIIERLTREKKEDTAEND